MPQLALRLRLFLSLFTTRAGALPWPGICVTLLFALSLRYRAFELDAMTNVDTFSNWIRWTDRFMRGLENGNLRATYQTHHPGVTLMWLVGLLRALFGVIGQPLDPFTLKLATAPVALVGSLFAPATYLITCRLLGPSHRATALIAAVAIATEPMFMAHSRNAHLDMLVTAFAWTSALSAIVCCQTLSRKWALGSGVLLGLAILSKVSSAGFALGIVLLFTLEFLRRSGQRRSLFWLLVIIGSTATAVVFAMCPALWVAPFKVLSRFWIGLNREINIASPVMFLGKTTTQAFPIAIYPAFALFLLTPEFLLPAILGVVTLLGRKGAVRCVLLSAICVTLPFTILVANQAHVTQRYMLPALPCIALISALVLERWFVAARKRHWAIAAMAVFTILSLRVQRAEQLHPLPITYCSTWTGVDCADVFHLGWGEGTKEAALRIAAEIKPKTPNQAIAILGGGYAGSMATWTPVSRVNAVEEAELLVDYICDWQRNGKAAMVIKAYVSEKQLSPLFEIKHQGRSYVRVYAGPKFAGLR